MERIGFICDIRETSNPTKIVGSARLKRAVPMAHALREHGVELLAYSPRHVNPETRMALGYTVGDRFTPVIAPVPPVNGYWFQANTKARNISGMGVTAFIDWTRKNGIEIYPPREFRQLTLDKYLSYRLVATYDPALTPHTEAYAGTSAQLARFLDRGDTVFLKPRFGSQGESVIVIRKDGSAPTLSCYAGKKRTTVTWTSPDDLRDDLAARMADRPYVIQEGVKVMRHAGCTFIVRVIMLNDGRDWTWTHKLVMTAADGDVANTSQGGTNHTLEEALPLIFGERDALRVTGSLRRASFDLTAFIDTLHPGMNMELAFDFLVDVRGRVWIAEFDVQPGLMKPGMNVDRPFHDLFNLLPDERPLYEKYVAPHGRALATFLLSKLRARRAA